MKISSDNEKSQRSNPFIRCLNGGLLKSAASAERIASVIAPFSRNSLAMTLQTKILLRIIQPAMMPPIRKVNNEAQRQPNHEPEPGNRANAQHDRNI